MTAIIHVELFGIPKKRAGISHIDLAANTLGELLQTLETKFPQLANTCIRNGQFLPGYLANLNSQQFVTDPNTPLPTETTVLILSADAGG